MKQKEKNKTDFTKLDNVKQLILVNEKVHSNWMSGKPLDEGLQAYKESNPDDFSELVSAYRKMNEAMGNPPINEGSDCCGGGCGCHV